MGGPQFVGLAIQHWYSTVRLPGMCPPDVLTKLFRICGSHSTLFLGSPSSKGGVVESHRLSYSRWYKFLPLLWKWRSEAWAEEAPVRTFSCDLRVQFSKVQVYIL